MALIGKAVDLRVRPTTSIDLCYPVDGVISFQGQHLGSRVQSLNVENLYTMLSQTASERPPSETEPGGDSRLVWNSQRITSYLMNVAGQSGASGLGPTLLSRVRNVIEAADLDNALAMRQNAYLTSYSPDVLAAVRRVYHGDPRDPDAARYQLLSAAEQDIIRLHRGLHQAYEDSGWSDKVIETARSHFDNKSSQYGPGAPKMVYFEGISETLSWGFDYRFPSAENDLRYHQDRAEIRQAFLNAWRMHEMCEYGHITFANELETIDRSIRKAQSAYIDTFLVSPVGGLVTAVFHGQGDFVRAGEPVLRIEADEDVYLVGTIKLRGMLRVGTELTVSTTLFEAPGAPVTSVTGWIVAVRGHDSVSEQWDVLVACSNRTATDEPVLPLNYNFDFESTTVEVMSV